MSPLCHNEIIDIYQCSSAHKLQCVIVTVILRGGSQLQSIKWIDYQVYIQFKFNLQLCKSQNRTILRLFLRSGVIKCINAKLCLFRAQLEKRHTLENQHH